MVKANPLLLGVLIFLLGITTAEVFFLKDIGFKKNSTPLVSGTSLLTPTPTLILTSNNDQSYRYTDAPNRLTRFLNTALMGFLTELSNYNPTKSVNIKVDSLFEGTIEALYRGKEAEKIHPPDSEFPERTVVAIINITDLLKSNGANKTIEILLVESELPHLTIFNEKNEKLTLEDIVGRRARINRIIELPVTKGGDIVTLDPIVYTNIVIYDKK